MTHVFMDIDIDECRSRLSLAEWFVENWYAAEISLLRREKTHTGRFSNTKRKKHTEDSPTQTGVKVAALL